MKTLRSASIFRFAAYIGWDWSDGKHDVCLHCVEGGAHEPGQIKHSPEAIEEWARELRTRFGGRPIAIALELDKGPIVYALRKYDFIVLFPVNPASLAKYREAFTHSGAKDDPTDAELALELLLKHPEQLQPLNPQSARMRALEQLVEMRRRLVDDQTRITNRLTSALKNYFPQALQWFEDKGTLVFCDFLQRWPTLKSVHHARRTTLERFFHEHNVRQASAIKRRIESIKTSVALTEDDAVIQPSALLVKAWSSSCVSPSRRSRRSTARSQLALQRIRTFTSCKASLQQVRSLHRAYSPPSASSANAIPTPTLCSATPESPRSPPAAATPVGSIGAGVVPPSCDKPSSSGRRSRSHARSGPMRSIANNAAQAKPIKPLYARSPTNGSESCIAAG